MILILYYLEYSNFDVKQRRGNQKQNECQVWRWFDVFLKIQFMHKTLEEQNYPSASFKKVRYI